MQTSVNPSRQRWFLVAALGLLMLFFLGVVIALNNRDDIYIGSVWQLLLLASYLCCLGIFWPYWRRLMAPLIFVVLFVFLTVSCQLSPVSLCWSYLGLWQKMMLIIIVAFFITASYATRYVHGRINRSIYLVCIMLYTIMGLLMLLATMT